MTQPGPRGVPSGSQGVASRPVVDEGALATVPLARPRPRGLAVVFRALRHRNYRLYFLGQLISLTGSWMQTTALMWLTFELTRQSRWTALVSAAQVLPTFFLGAWGGVLADRWPKRSLIFVTQAAFTILALVLAGLVMGGAVTPWQLLMISTAIGLVQAVDLPARLAFVNDMVGREDLVNAVGLNSLLFNLARALGPALAGPLLAVLGPELCFVANALSFLPLLWALARMDVRGSPPHREQDEAVPGGGGTVLAGFSYLAGRPTLAFLVLLSGVVTFCGWPFLVLLPALATYTLRVDEAGYSWMLSSTGVGALAAALVVATAGSLARWKPFIATGCCVIVVSLLGLSVAGNLALGMAYCALIGFGLVLFMATGQSVLQLSAGDHNRGRVLAVWAMILSGALPLGNQVAGEVADRLGASGGAPAVLGLLGLVLAGASVALLVLLWLWNQFRPPVEHGPSQMREVLAQETGGESP